MGTRRFLTWFAAVVLVGAPAFAQEPEAVIVGGACLPSDTSAPEVFRILQAELVPRRVQLLNSLVSPSSTDDIVVEISDCSAFPSGARVMVSRRGQRSDLSITLSDAVPGTASRTFALALAEAVRTAAAAPNEPSPSPAPVAPSHDVGPAHDVGPPPPPAPSEPSSHLTLQGSAAFRYVTKTATPLLGAELGVAERRFEIGISVLGTRQSTALGSESLIALAASASADAIEVTSFLALRTVAELGVAVGSGSPAPSAEGHTAAVPHFSLGAGAGTLVKLGAGYLFDGYAGAGYGSSLVVQAGGRDALGLSGWFVACSVGVRGP